MPRLPLLRVLLPFVLGIAAADLFGIPPGPAAGLAAAGAAAWWLGLRAAGECALGLGLGALALALRLHAPLPAVDAQPVVVTLLEPAIPLDTVCLLPVFVHGQRPGRALLRAPQERCVLLPGQRALARVRLAPLRPATNPGAGSPRRRWQRRGFSSGGSVSHLVPAASPTASLPAALARLRARIGAALDPAERPSRAGALLRALVVGDRSRLAPSGRDVFVHSGTAHLLAVSGLHVGWLFAVTQIGVGWLLRRSRAPALLRRARGVALLAGALAALGYAALAGFGAPALRASAMAFAGTLAVLGGRPGAAANALCAAALVVLSLEPAALFELSFALSFSAVAGILVWAPPPARAAALLHATAAASLATAPWAAALGAPLPAGALLANALAIPLLAGVVVPLGLLAGAAALLNAGAAALLTPCATAAAELGLRLVEGLASPDLLRGAAQPALLASALAAGGFALRLAVLARSRAAIVLALLAAGLALLLAIPDRAHRYEVLTLDVGHGDALVVRSGEAAWLVDAGPRFRHYDAGRRVVLPALRAEGIARLDALVVTHGDRDHVGGALAVVRGVPVDELWLGLDTWRHPALRPLRREAARRGVVVRVLAAGASPARGVSVLWPELAAHIAGDNDASLVLRISLGHGCALLAGDVPAHVERRLAAALEPCAFLKLSHHGSRTSSDPLFLDRLSPELAVASSGRRTRSPLPHKSVRKRLARRSVSLYETARTGALRVRFGPVGSVAEPFLVAPLDGTRQRARPLP